MVQNGRNDETPDMNRKPLEINRRLSELHCQLMRNAARQGKKREVQRLLNDELFIVDVNSKEPDTLRTALHLAAENDHVDVAKVLVEKGASLECEDRWGQTPGMLAEDLHSEMVSKYLENLGAHKI